MDPISTNPYSAALAGMTAASNKLNSAASDIASTFSSPLSGQPPADSDTNLPKDIVDMDVSRLDFDANMQVVKAENRMTRKLLDVFG